MAETGSKPILLQRVLSTSHAPARWGGGVRAQQGLSALGLSSSSSQSTKMQLGAGRLPSPTWPWIAINSVWKE